MKKFVFIKNAAIMTVSSLILRFAGIVFKVWLAAKIGAEGIGLYQLVFSVYVLISTFATSGISTAVTRLISEESALGSKRGEQKIILRAIELTLIIALVSLGIIFFGADFFAHKFLGDIRGALSLKILGFSLPFMGISSCIRGYFIAHRKAAPASLSQLIEQAVRIGFIMLIINSLSLLGTAGAIAAVILGDTVAEAVSALYLYISYLFDIKKRANTDKPRKVRKIVSSILRISAPISAGRYLNSGLRTIENMLVPKMLLRFSAKSNALSQFGMIKGMALPILFFPSTVLNSVSTLLIPEMSEARAYGNVNLLKRSTEKTLALTSLLGFIFSAIFLVSGRELGNLIYKSADVGFLLCVLSPIVPLMYLDSVSDGILKGLDQQNFTFRTCLTDSSLRIFMILFFVSRFGMNGFIGIMYFSNLFTCLLNAKRLIKITRAEIKPLKQIVLPIVSALFSAILPKFLLGFLNAPLILNITLSSIVSVALYALILKAFDCTDSIKMR